MWSRTFFQQTKHARHHLKHAHVFLMAFVFVAGGHVHKVPSHTLNFLSTNSLLFENQHDSRLCCVCAPLSTKHVLLGVHVLRSPDSGEDHSFSCIGKVSCPRCSMQHIHLQQCNVERTLTLSTLDKMAMQSAYGASSFIQKLYKARISAQNAT